MISKMRETMTAARKNWHAYALIAPAMLCIIVIVIAPALYNLRLSFYSGTNKDIYRYKEFGEPLNFVLFGNYQKLIKDDLFWYSLFASMLFMVLAVAGTITLGMAVGLLLNCKFPGRTIVSLAVLLPWIIPRVATTILWKWIYDGLNGILNHFMLLLGFSSFHHYSWLAHEVSAFGCVVFVVVWQSFPFIAVAILAGMQTISSELYEAAAIDGANVFQRFRHITLPMLRNLLTILIILSTIWDLKVFDQMWIMTEGGPGTANYILGIYIYIVGVARGNITMAAAISIVMLLIMFVITVIYIKVIGGKTVEIE